jgi:uroporphyrinogen-III synthase
LRLLVTRPEAEAERTAKALRTRGYDVLVAPVLRIEPHRNVELGAGPWSALAMTSGNAARAIAMHPQLAQLMDLPLFVVGVQTAKAARDAGFRRVTSADGDAGDLATLIAARGIKGTLLYLAGDDRARDLAGELAAGGVQVDTVVVYRAVAVSALPSAVQTALARQELDGVLHYSRRTASILLDCANAAGVLSAVLRLTHYCLSQRASEPLAAAGAGDIRIAARPEEAAMLDLVGG